MRVLGPLDKSLIEAFEKDRLEKAPGDPFEKQIQSWSAPWRPEALEHYLSLGWSFGLFEQEQLVGYMLGQPLLFFQSYAQSLWVEHIGYSQPDQLEKLIEIAYRWSRDKHLQKVLISARIIPSDFRSEFSLRLNEEGIFEIPTAKYK